MTVPTHSRREPEDDLHERLLRASEQWQAAQPPLPARAVLPGRASRRVHWLPPLAAAAVAVVVSGSVVLLGGIDRPLGPVPITAVVAQADARDPGPRAEGDGPQIAPPPLGPSPRPMYNADCAAGEVSATLTLVSGLGTLRVSGGAPQEQPCGLPGTRPSLRIVDGDSTTVVPTSYPVQPTVPNPPRRTDGVLDQQAPLSAAVRWDSWCGPRTGTLHLVGLAADPVTVALDGGFPSCQDRTSRASLERLSNTYSATGLVPTERAGLRVVVQYPDEVPPGFVRPYTVRLQNPTRAAISLRPCPTYLLDQQNPASGAATGGASSTSTGALPCKDLPERLAPGEEATIAMEARFGSQDPKLRGEQPLATWWGIAGANPSEQDVPMRFPAPPRPLADVAWKDTPAPPGKPREPKAGDPLPYGPLQPTIEGLPAQASPGDIVRYSVRLTNAATGGSPVLLDPCPGFVQYLQVGVRDARRELVDEHYLNCGQAPASIPAGTSVLLRMQLAIPKDARPGEGLLTWKVGKLDTGGSPSDFAKLRIIE